MYCILAYSTSSTHSNFQIKKMPVNIYVCNLFNLFQCTTFLVKVHLPSHKFGLLGHASEGRIEAPQVIEKVACITLGQKVLVFCLMANPTLIEWDWTCFCQQQ